MPATHSTSPYFLLTAGYALTVTSISIASVTQKHLPRLIRLTIAPHRMVGSLHTTRSCELAGRSNRVRMICSTPGCDQVQPCERYPKRGGWKNWTNPNAGAYR